MDLFNREGRTQVGGCEGCAWCAGVRGTCAWCECEGCAGVRGTCAWCECEGCAWCAGVRGVVVVSVRGVLGVLVWLVCEYEWCGWCVGVRYVLGGWV